MRQVKCIKPLGHLTKDRIYTVVGEPAKDAKWLTVVDDRGECATYDSARFEVIHSPKATPDFRQMQHIADEVKITCPVVEEADRRKAMINLKNAMLDGQLKEQLTARREIALQDCDANLAALLYSAKDRITELEDQLTVLKRGAQ